MRTSGYFADAVARLLAGRIFDRQPRPGERTMDPEPYEVSKARIECAEGPGWEGFPKGHTMEQTPSVGRSVHYVAYGTPGGEFPAGVCRAAVITEVIDDHPVSAHQDAQVVGLCVLNPTGIYFNRNIRYDPAKAVGTWHWPERV